MVRSVDKQGRNKYNICAARYAPLAQLLEPLVAQCEILLSILRAIYNDNQISYVAKNGVTY